MTTTSSNSSGGLPGWAWTLIGAGAAGVIFGAVALARRPSQPPRYPPQGPTGRGYPPAGSPPAGYPEDYPDEGPSGGDHPPRGGP